MTDNNNKNDFNEKWGINKINNSPLLNLLFIREKLMEHFRPIINKYDITEQQWRIIRFLSENSHASIDEISEVAIISNASLTGILNRMEENGLINRKTSEKDRRSSVIFLTDKSKDIYYEIAKKSNSKYIEIENKIGENEIGILISILNIVKEKIKK